MRATYKLGRDVITEFEAQNAGNSISGVQISKIFWGGDARYWNEPRSRYEAGSAPAECAEAKRVRRRKKEHRKSSAKRRMTVLKKHLINATQIL